VNKESIPDEAEDPPMNWLAAIIPAIGVLGAMLVGMGNMSVCWHVMP
jgi:hypothetical protein